MKRLTIILLFFASVLQGQTGAGYWYGSTEPGTITPEPDTLTLTYWNDFILLHIANTGITEDVNGVSEWQDRSGNGNHSTQSVNANKPSTDVDGNVVFDGVNDYLEFANPFSTAGVSDSAFTIFCVFEIDVIDPINRKIYEISDGVNNDAGLFVLLFTAELSSNDSLINAVRTNVNAAEEWSDSVSISTSTVYLSCVAASESLNSEFYINASQVGSILSDGDWYGAPTEGYALGTQRGKTSQFMDGKLKFFGITGRKFTPSEIATTNSELNSFFTIY